MCIINATRSPTRNWNVFAGAIKSWITSSFTSTIVFKSSNCSSVFLDPAHHSFFRYLLLLTVFVQQLFVCRVQIWCMIIIFVFIFCLHSLFLRLSKLLDRVNSLYISLFFLIHFSFSCQEVFNLRALNNYRNSWTSGVLTWVSLAGAKDWDGFQGLGSWWLLYSARFARAEGRTVIFRKAPTTPVTDQGLDKKGWSANF